MAWSVANPASGAPSANPALCAADCRPVASPRAPSGARRLTASATVDRVGAVSSPATTTAAHSPGQSPANPIGTVATPSSPSSSQAGNPRASVPCANPPATDATPNTATTPAAHDT